MEFPLQPSPMHLEVQNAGRRNLFTRLCSLLSGEEMAPSQSSSYSTAVVDDPHFEQVGNELKEIQAKVDSLLFGSVFLRLPKGLSDDDKCKWGRVIFPFIIWCNNLC